MNKKVLFGIIAVAAVGIGIFCSIDEDTTKVSKDNELYANLGEHKEKASDKIDSVEIYFDASSSMQGYLKNDDTRFATQVSTAGDWAENSTMALLKTGNNVKAYNKAIADIASLAGDFNGGDTQFDKLLPFLCKKTNSNKVCAFVTDGILYVNQNTQKGLGEYENILAKAIKNSGNAFAVMKYSSEFDGSYFNMKNQPSKLNEDNRPYYIIFTGTPENILKIKKAAELEKEANKKPELALYLGTHDLTAHNKSTMEDNAASFRVAPNKDITLSVTLPDCMTFMWDQYGKECFSGSNVKVTLGNKELKEGKDYDLDVQKGTNIIMKVIMKANPAQQGTAVVEVANNIPQQWASLSIDDDSNINSARGKTFGLIHLLKGIKNAVEDKNTPLVKAEFTYEY